LDAALLDGNLHGRPVDDIAAALTRRKVPFLFVTGYGPESLPRAFSRAAILSKPFSQQQLIDAAARLVERRGDVVRLRDK
jgi:CheY-like chemotaxis protein